MKGQQFQVGALVEGLRGPVVGMLERIPAVDDPDLVTAVRVLPMMAAGRKEGGRQYTFRDGHDLCRGLKPAVGQRRQAHGDATPDGQPQPDHKLALAQMEEEIPAAQQLTHVDRGAGWRGAAPAEHAGRARV